jgi:hypothetical protein
MARFQDLPPELVGNILALAKTENGEGPYNWCLVSKQFYSTAVMRLYAEVTVKHPEPESEQSHQLVTLVRSLLCYPNLAQYIKTLRLAQPKDFFLRLAQPKNCYPVSTPFSCADLGHRRYALSSADIQLFQDGAEKLYPQLPKPTLSLESWKERLAVGTYNAIIGLLLLLATEIEHLNIQLCCFVQGSIVLELAKSAIHIPVCGRKGFSRLKTLSVDGQGTNSYREDKNALKPFFLLPSLRTFKFGGGLERILKGSMRNRTFTSCVTHLDLTADYTYGNFLTKLFMTCPSLEKLTLRLTFDLEDHRDILSSWFRALSLANLPIKSLTVVRAVLVASEMEELANIRRLDRTIFLQGLSLCGFTQLKSLSLDMSPAYRVLNFVVLNRHGLPLLLPTSLSRLELHAFRLRGFIKNKITTNR